MGFQAGDYFGCGVSAQMLMDTADAFDFRNDLDMMEVGNGAAFDADNGDELGAAQTVGSHESHRPSRRQCGRRGTTCETLAAVTNAATVGVNQDPLGRQARRIASVTPTNDSLVLEDHVLLLPCA